MPQLQAAKKALRVDQRRRKVNDRWRRKLRAALHGVRDAVSAGEKKAAEEAVVKAESVLDRVSRRNIVHPNKAARKKSQLRRAVANLK